MSARLLPSRRAIRAQGRRASGMRAGCGAQPRSRAAEQRRRDIGRGSAIGSEDARRCIRFPVYCRPAPGWRNGRRGGLKNRYRKVCGFDSRSGHHLFDSPANSKAPPPYRDIPCGNRVDEAEARRQRVFSASPGRACEGGASAHRRQVRESRSGHHLCFASQRARAPVATPCGNRADGAKTPLAAFATPAPRRARSSPSPSERFT